MSKREYDGSDSDRKRVVRGWDEDSDDGAAAASVGSSPDVAVATPRRPLGFSDAQTQELLKALVAQQQAAQRVRQLVEAVDRDGRCVTVPAELLDVPFELNERLVDAMNSGAVATQTANEVPELIADVWSVVFDIMFRRGPGKTQVERTERLQTIRTLRLVSRTFCALANPCVSAIRVPNRTHWSRGGTFRRMFDLYTHACTIFAPASIIVRENKHDRTTLLHDIEEVLCTISRARPLDRPRYIRLTRASGIETCRIMPPIMMNNATRPPLYISGYNTPDYEAFFGLPATPKGTKYVTVCANDNAYFWDHGASEDAVRLLGTFSEFYIGFDVRLGPVRHDVATRLSKGQHMQIMHVLLSSYGRDCLRYIFDSDSPPGPHPAYRSPLYNINTGREELLKGAVERGELSANTTIVPISEPPIVHVYKPSTTDSNVEAQSVIRLLKLLHAVWPGGHVHVTLHTPKSMSWVNRHEFKTRISAAVQPSVTMSCIGDATEALELFKDVGEMRP